MKIPRTASGKIRWPVMRVGRWEMLTDWPMESAWMAAFHILLWLDDWRAQLKKSAPH